MHGLPEKKGKNEKYAHEIKPPHNDKGNGA
jgi:hypothetical protein